MWKGLPAGGSFAFMDAEKGAKYAPCPGIRAKAEQKVYYLYLTPKTKNSA